MNEDTKQLEELKKKRREERARENEQQKLHVN